MLCGSPPNASAFSRTHSTAAIWSRRPMFVAPPGTGSGYEGIKHASAQASRERAEELVDLLRRPRLPLTSTTR
jgi:hypothetical protein